MSPRSPDWRLNRFAAFDADSESEAARKKHVLFWVFHMDFDSLSFFRDEQWNEPRRWRKLVCATMKATTSRTRTEKFQFQPPRVRGQKDPSSKIKKVIDQKICNKSLFKLAFYQNKTIEQKLWFICFHPHENNSIICEVKFIIPRFIS